jgi:hypothetical protein
MALAALPLAGAAPITPAAFAAPTVSEAVARPGPNKFLWVKVGGTATTITIVRPGTHPGGDVVDDNVIGPLTSVERIIPIGAEYKGADGNATVQFSQVTGVTALLITTA